MNLQVIMVVSSFLLGLCMTEEEFQDESLEYTDVFFDDEEEECFPSMGGGGPPPDYPEYPDYPEGGGRIRKAQRARARTAKTQRQRNRTARARAKKRNRQTRSVSAQVSPDCEEFRRKLRVELKDIRKNREGGSRNCKGRNYQACWMNDVMTARKRMGREDPSSYACLQGMRELYNVREWFTPGKEKQTET